ncbi:MAG TPA: ethanolamine ammonia-lyase reactivating factor EutA [Pirellulales bacterium]|nr:ethanolamine ammonia-lyase reactivating factor EutA [Pirellulales bacterium]
MVLIGLDFGSTTTSGVVARATARGGADRISEFTDLQIEFRSTPVFTPFEGESLDERRLTEWLDRWRQAAGVEGRQVAAGGAIVTGLAAKADNAGIVRRLVHERFGEALIATADDPALESWLAFMANTRDLSLAEPDRWFLNFDIGGGTTNVALGRAGCVERVGCYAIGARHLQCEPGTLRIIRLSTIGRQLLDALKINRQPGELMSAGELAALLDFLIEALERIACGKPRQSRGAAADFLAQLPYAPPADATPVITFSGGVGEWIYQLAQEGNRPATTAYGDLGGELAWRIAQSQTLAAEVTSYAPLALGRATVVGLAAHQVQLCGGTCYLPRPRLLPLAGLPVVGRLTDDASDEQIDAALRLACRGNRGACLALEVNDTHAASIRTLGNRLAERLERSGFPPGCPLVLLLNQNVGKTLGNYATRWGRLAVTLIVLDELPDRGAAFVTLGKPVGQLVPVSFYGMGVGTRL